MAKAKRLPSGSWRCVASYTDEEGKYKQKSFTAPTKKEAEYKANAFLMDKKDGMKPENKTLGQLADAFIENRSSILSPSTIRGYRLIRKTAFQEIINVRLGILTKEMYQKAVNTYAKERSPKTVLSAHAFYNKLLKENGYDIGSMGSTTDPSRIFKGHIGAGQMGCDQVTIQNLDIVKVDPELNLIAVRGAIPGPKGGLVLIKSTVKTHRVKNVESGISNNPQKASGRNPQKASARTK